MMKQNKITPKISVESILERIFAIRQINRTDQHTLMSALLSKDALSEKDQRQINQVYEGIQKGFIKIVE
jgi:predicted transcriptional regulator